VRNPLAHDFQCFVAIACGPYYVALAGESRPQHARNLRLIVHHENIALRFLRWIRHFGSCVTICTSTAGASRRKSWIAEKYKNFLQPVSAERPKTTCVMCFSCTILATSVETFFPRVLTICAPRFSAKRRFSSSVRL